MLADALADLFLTALHLNDGEGNAVHEQNNIGTDARTLRPVDRKLARHVEGVCPNAVSLLPPIDIAEGPFPGLALYSLRQCDAELQKIRLPLIRT